MRRRSARSPGRRVTIQIGGRQITSNARSATFRAKSIRGGAEPVLVGAKPGFISKEDFRRSARAAAARDRPVALACHCEWIAASLQDAWVRSQIPAWLKGERVAIPVVTNGLLGAVPTDAQLAGLQVVDGCYFEYEQVALSGLDSAFRFRVSFFAGWGTPDLSTVDPMLLSEIQRHVAPYARHLTSRGLFVAYRVWCDDLRRRMPARRYTS